jgi:hypothetical protein
MLRRLGRTSMERVQPECVFIVPAGKCAGRNPPKKVHRSYGVAEASTSFWQQGISTAKSTVLGNKGWSLEATKTRG